MDNSIAGTPSSGSSELYPEQNLTTTRLDTNTRELQDGAPPPLYTMKTCSACSLIPTPHWAYGVCSRQQLRARPPLKSFTGRNVGDFRMTASSELVNITGHFIPEPLLAPLNACDVRVTAAQRGNGWQSYNPVLDTCSRVATPRFDATFS